MSLKLGKINNYSRSKLKNIAVIMAGGRGERLDPFTKILPKPLIPVGDKPIIDKVMENFNKYGISNFVLTLNYKKEFIKMYFRENKNPYNVKFLEENEYLGTAGGLSMLNGMVKDTFFVCNCDTIIKNDFKDILVWHKLEKALLTIIGCHKEIVIPYGTLEQKGSQLKKINEKPVLNFIINTGMYVMEPEVLELVPSNERLGMNQLIEKVMKRGKVAVYPISDGWFDIGQWKEYRDSLRLLGDGK